MSGWCLGCRRGPLLFLGGSWEHIGSHASVECGGRESPGERVTFFCFAKRKSPKKRRPPVCDPFAERRGKPASCRLRGAPQNSLRAGALRSNNCGESVHEAWALRRPCHPPTAPPQAQPAGVGHPNSRTANIHSGHCCARHRLAGASATRCASWAERSKGPWGCLVPHSPLDAPRSAAGGVARVPQYPRASWTDSLRLFERRAPARSEFHSAHRLRAPQVAPERSAGDADSGVAFLLGTFLWRSKEKYLACRATPGLRPQQRHAAQSAPKRKHYKNNSYQRISH